MRKDGKKLLALSMASVLALVPMIASAAPGNSKKPVKDDVKIENVIEDNQDSLINEEVNYLLATGEIIEINESVVDGKKVVNILVDDNNDDIGDMWYNLSKKVIALSDGEDIDLDELKVGDEITAIYKDAPMILIYPGRLTPELVILNDNSINNVKVSLFDEMLVSKDNMLKLILNSDTDIEAYKNGASLKEEDIENSYAVVIYGATTRSIPAQTLADGVVKVIVFEDSVKVPGSKPVLPIPGSPSAPGNSGTAHSKNAVSKIAKDYGYKVKWDPKEKVVTLTKDSDVLKVFIGKDQVEKNGQLYKTSVISSLEKNRAYVSQEIINLLD